MNCWAGLDPAGPFFSLNDTETRLDASDGDFVDIIHTDGGTLTGNELGFLPPIGHIDFYPNGGKTQPGCKNVELSGTNRVNENHEWVLTDLLCFLFCFYT